MPTFALDLTVINQYIPIIIPITTTATPMTASTITAVLVPSVFRIKETFLI
jgi:hypothetical protein